MKRKSIAAPAAVACTLLAATSQARAARTALDARLAVEKENVAKAERAAQLTARAADYAVNELKRNNL